MHNPAGTKYTRKSMTVFSMNVRSLNKNKEAVAATLLTHQPSVMTLQETWLTNNPPNLHDEYDRYASPPKKSEGVAVYARKELNCKAYQH